MGEGVGEICSQVCSMEGSIVCDTCMGEVGESCSQVYSISGGIIIM